MSDSAETTELGRALAKALTEIASLTPEVLTILTSAIAGSSSDRTKSILQGAIDRHSELTNAGLNSSSTYIMILERFQNSRHGAKLQIIQSLFHSLDPEMLEDEKLRDKCEQAFDELVKSPEIWEKYVFAIELTLYSIPVLHLNLLRAFLGRPTPSDKAFANAVKLFKSTAKELAGELIPLLGVMETIIELTVPAVEKDIESMRHATREFDRLFLLDDSLARAVRIAGYVEDSMRISDDATKTYCVNFDDKSAWLVDTLTDETRK
jgi:hypothetical protein